MGAVGPAIGAVVVTRCDRLRRADCSGRMSACVADSLTILEGRSWSLEQGSRFSLRISESSVLTVSSWVRDGHYAGDGGAEDGEAGPFACGYGLESERGEVLDQVGVQLEAVSCF